MTLPSDILSHSPEEAARRIALGFLEEARLATLRLDDPGGPEALHDFRVAVRRLRSTLRAWREELGACVRKRHRKALREIQAATGAGRDAEVAVEWLAGQRVHLRGRQRQGHTWLTERLEQRHARAIETARGKVRKDFDRIHDKLRARLEVMRIELHVLEPEPGGTFAKAITRTVRQYANDLIRLLEELGSPDDEREAHAARIASKRLRYLVEPLRQHAEGASGIVRKCKRLQDTLGDLRDAHILRSELVASAEVAEADHARRLHVLAREADGERLRRESRRTVRPGLLELTRRVQRRVETLYAQLQSEWIEGGVHVLGDDVERFAARLGRADRPGVETERTYLLSRFPEIPEPVEVVEIDQGWLPGECLREQIRCVRSDDAVHYYRTIKFGRGVERTEIEEAANEEVFDRMWLLTKDCRIRRRRHWVPDGNLIWKVDEFLDRDLSLAEIELDDAAQQPTLPGWLAPHVVREVTDDPDYQNYELALRLSKKP